MIVLIDPTKPSVRIELTGEFAEDDAALLLRTWPELRRSKSPDQLPLEMANEEEA